MLDLAAPEGTRDPVVLHSDDGARAVLIGRPVVWGLTVGGEAGVRHSLELLRAEVTLALQLLGCRSVGDVTRNHVAPV